MWEKFNWWISYLCSYKKEEEEIITQIWSKYNLTQEVHRSNKYNEFIITKKMGIAAQCLEN